MGKGNFSDEFKRDAVRQITERGYRVAEVSQRLGVSQHSLSAWKRKFSKAGSNDDGKDAEIRQLKRELSRVTEERDILKNRPRPAARLWAVETPATVAAGGELPMAYWRYPTPSKNVAHGLMRT